MDELILCLKAVADPIRMRLLMLCRQGECSVSELTGVVGLSQPRVSQHLKRLCDADLLERFRDGQRVYYRVPVRGSAAAVRRQVLALIPAREAAFSADERRLRELRSAGIEQADSNAAPLAAEGRDIDRALHRAIVELTVTAPIGDLLDIGCGRGRLLKLLASRANRAIGVDVDANARDLARAELLLAGLPNCSLRAGDMYRLPFAAAEFDTVILDDVLADASEPVSALREAGRLVGAGGRLFILQSLEGQNAAALQRQLAGWCAEAALRLAPSRLAPKASPHWLLAVARPAERTAAAA